MKGLAFRKLSRTTSHRQSLLRNLVSSLILHERISTTVPKAREAQREAEKIITKVKRAAQQGRISQLIKARDYVYDREDTLPRLALLAERYASRPGGYTRIHLHGARPGDNAPRAILELVDNPAGDIKLEMTARAVGRETFKRFHSTAGSSKDVAMRGDILDASQLSDDKRFHPITRKNIAKVLRFDEPSPGGSGPGPKTAMLVEKAREAFRRMQVLDSLDGGRERTVDESAMAAWGSSGPIGQHLTKPMKGARRYAGVLKPADEEVRIRGRKLSPVRVSKGVFANRRTNVVIPSQKDVAKRSARG